MTSHTEMCEGCEVTSVEEGHDAERVTARSDEIVGSLKWLKDETSADLTALEKQGLDRKTNHQDPVKAETQPRPARPPPWRDKMQQGFNVVACNPVQRHEDTSQEGVKIFPPLPKHPHQFFVEGTGNESLVTTQVHGSDKCESN